MSNEQLAAEHTFDLKLVPCGEPQTIRITSGEHADKSYTGNTVGLALDFLHDWLDDDYPGLAIENTTALVGWFVSHGYENDLEVGA